MGLQDVCLTYRASQIGRSRSRTSRFIVSAEGEGTASGSQPSLDEINDSIDQPLEEEEPTFEDMLQKVCKSWTLDFSNETLRVMYILPVTLTIDYFAENR